MNFLIFQAPLCNAFSSSRMWLSNFSSSSRQQSQLAVGVQVCDFSGWHYKSKVAMPQLDTLDSILSLTNRFMLS